MDPRLQVGVEYNPAVEEFNPTANWVVHAETAEWPLVTFGTSSDRIFTPEGNQAYFLTIAKSLPGTRLSPYLSLNYSEFESGFNFPAGLNYSLNDRTDILAMCDGRKTHLLLTFKFERSNVTLMAVDLGQPRLGLSIGWGF